MPSPMKVTAITKKIGQEFPACRRGRQAGKRCCLNTVSKEMKVNKQMTPMYCIGCVNSVYINASTMNLETNWRGN